MQKDTHEKQLSDMGKSLSHRGESTTPPYLNEHIGFSHAETISCCPSTTFDVQSSFLDSQQKTYAILCDGELYNANELLSDLRASGCFPAAHSDAELILSAYIQYGSTFISRLNGVFAFAIWDNAAETLLLYRDHAGIKPLFYTLSENTLVFASEPKALFAQPGVTPSISRDSLYEVLSVGPAHTPGYSMFQNVNEVLPGHYLAFSSKGISDFLYWDLTAKKHTDSYADTVDTVSFLVRDAVKRQSASDASVCSFLSGGIDSGIVTALAADCLREKNDILATFSFDFKENDIYFQSNAFQPERDLPYINRMLSHCPTNHTYLECDPAVLSELLNPAVLLRDTPGMTDVDASLFYFCTLVAKQSDVALTGECADEVFGGYPWFYREELLNRSGFLWSADIKARTLFLNEDFCTASELQEYADSRYQTALAGVPILNGESALEQRRRAVFYLTIKWFMQTLLDRMDRASSHCGLLARVPFADRRLMEYVFNVPWEMKYRNGVEKSLLRDACADLLPPELLHRKKSPYPKTYHPGYEKRLAELFSKIIQDTNAPIAPLIDREKAKNFMSSHKELGRPWYGQLMAGPQLMAYFIQINYWMETYGLTV